ncbi:MAG: hypothetical protein ACLUR5_10795 [Eubacterium ventriosum]
MNFADKVDNKLKLFDRRMWLKVFFTVLKNAKNRARIGVRDNSIDGYISDSRSKNA